MEYLRDQCDQCPVGTPQHDAGKCPCGTERDNCNQCTEPGSEERRRNNERKCSIQGSISNSLWCFYTAKHRDQHRDRE